MSELRWILLGLGALLIASVYFFARRPLPKLPIRRKAPAPDSADPETPSTAPADSQVEPAQQRHRSPEKVVTLRVVCRHQNEMKAQEAVLALKRVGLVHGKYGIFHRLADDGTDEPLFSVASLTEPGSFDLANLKGANIAGLSLFLVLPGRSDPVRRFDEMIELARDLADGLDGVLLDERGSSWSIQRERYIREEIIRYQHHLSRA